MSSPGTDLYPVLVKARSWSPWRRGTKYNPETGKYDKVWVTNWRPVYVAPGANGGLIKRFGPEPGFKKNLTLAERREVTAWARKRGYSAKLGDAVRVPKYPHLSGDVDVQPDLAKRLEAVGKDLGKVLWIASGNRTYEEQAELYADYLAGRGPLAAAPGTSNHHGGKAADVWLGGANIGTSRSARAALRRHGLCLPVAGETWHVEVGSTWRA